ncbi:MAG: 50S ribosomal protein L29 [Clostridiales bacterium]|nr:50S ribosomal protein L29 [Clostridiales bacterium]
MKADKLRDMTETELNNEIMKLKNELFNLRFQHVTGQLENPVRVRIVKKEIARAKTILREKELKRVNA